MSKKLLAALIALSMVGVYACEGESDDGDGGATGGSCTETVCENGTLKVCSQGKVISTKVCEKGCDGKKCADPSQPAPACTESACKDDKTLNLCQGGTIIPTNCPTGCDAAAKKCKDNPNAPTCTADACKDATVLNKCEGGKVLEVSCPNGCEANACKQAAPADCKCDDGSACPNGDKTKCSGAPADCKCDDGSACPDGDKTKCSGAPADCKCDDGSACPDGDKTKCSGAPADCKCDDGSACPDGDKTKCAAAGNEPKEGDPCDANKYEGGCSKDLKTRFYCGKEGTLVAKACEGETTCIVKGKNSSSCEAAACSNPIATGGKVGDCCDSSTYKSTCTDGNAHALVCTKNAVAQWDCADNDCKQKEDNPLQVSCKKGGTSTSCEGKLDKGGKVGDACDRNCYTQTCTNSGKNALVCWNDKVAEWTCATTCQDAGYDASKPLQVNCPKEGGSTPETCTEEDYHGKCADDKKSAVVCVGGKTKNYTCFKDICETRKDGTIYCPKDQEAIDNEEARKACEGKEKIKEGGKKGDCCDTENYKPAGCNTETNSGLRCSTGLIVEWTCSGSKKCDFDPNNTEFPGGKYSCK